MRAALLLLLGTLAFITPGLRGGPAGTEIDARRRLSELREEIARHDALYFNKAAPEISDGEYDRLKRELQAMEQAHPELAQKVAGMGDDRSGHFPTHAHRERMLSLNKAYTEADWRTFHAKLARQLGRTNMVFVIEPKYDGLAISLTYERGGLVRAVTRGNGDEGDDVTANVRLIEGLPAALRAAEGAPFPARCELRGEVYIDDTGFARVNARREAAGEEPFAHPRNLAAGTLKSGNPDDTGQRRLSVVIHGWGAWEGGSAPASQQAFQAQVRAWGLPAVTHSRSAQSADEGWAAVLSLGRERSELGFPVDGAVVKLNDVALRAAVGTDEHAPRWAIACKYESEKAIARLHAIVIQVGRTGVLTPVAEFEPVVLGGSTVSRATLHNQEEIARRDIRIGDFIEVEKAGEIIPAITGVVLGRRVANGTKPYVFPDRCPSCDTRVVVKPREATVRCPNARCPAQLQRRLEHFASVQCMDIRGLGPATLAMLLRRGVVRSPADLYRLRREDWLALEGVGGGTADRLLKEIGRSKQAGLSRVIQALGIRNVGEATARKLANRCDDLESLMRLTQTEFEAVAGPAAADSIREFLDRPENRADIRALIAAGINPRRVPGPSGRLPLAGKVVVFTGTLAGQTRAEAAKKVEAAGGVVRDSVNRSTDYVVAGEGAGAKRAAAEKLGVKIIDQEEWERLLGGG